MKRNRQAGLARSTGPVVPFSSLVSAFGVVVQLARREVVGRYRGSLLGFLWTFATPVLMLAAYTFVFTVVFDVRWGRQVESRGDFALVLFLGLIVYWILADSLARAPGLVLGHTNYVKKVVFPLHVLPWVVMGDVLVHTAMRLVVFVAAYLLFVGLPHPSFALLPLILAPLVVLTVGLLWFLAALGVFVRDVGEVVGVLLTLILFLSPLFYPADALPESLRWVLYANPITFPLVQTRAALWGMPIDWIGWVAYSMLAWGTVWLGFWWFQRLRPDFADAL